MTNKEFFNAYRGEPVLYKGNDIGAYVAGYVEEKYIDEENYEENKKIDKSEVNFDQF